MQWNKQSLTISNSFQFNPFFTSFFAQQHSTILLFHFKLYFNAVSSVCLKNIYISLEFLISSHFFPVNNMFHFHVTFASFMVNMEQGKEKMKCWILMIMMSFPSFIGKTLAPYFYSFHCLYPYMNSCSFLAIHFHHFLLSFSLFNFEAQQKFLLQKNVWATRG